MNIGPDFTFDDIVRSSAAMESLIELAKKVAPTDAVLLITGESGTGKELFALATHNASHRAGGPFIAINCAAVPDTLLEAELFGHEKGAFTGAQTTRKGRFEQAHGGTLFLDEIGDMSLPSQAKILRALQERTIQRVGGAELVPVDIRILCATNRKLAEQVRQGLFRQDLYYRLNEVAIDIPPLRERGEDLIALIKRFIDFFNERYSKNIRSISPGALEVLKRHPWPGNVRELEHLIHHAILMADGDTVWVEHIPSTGFFQTTRLEPSGEDESSPAPELMSLDDVEQRHIRRVLRHTNWNKTQAAKILNVSRPTLDRKIDKYLLKRE
jgi:transcriptional regulator with PAS, ATPase and Fis domain